MAKINKEEYEHLKSLDDKWKWIARDKTTNKSKRKVLFAFPDKPCKHKGFNQWMNPSRTAGVDLIFSELFQFIQWEDENPYNIQELIDEYEADESHKKTMADNLRPHLPNLFNESEETEVKKDLKWLKNQIDLRDTGTIDREDPQFYVNVGLRMALDFLNQLDEPEVLSREWIDDNKQHITGHGADKNGIDRFHNAPFVSVYDLRSLLVPNQEELESKIKALIKTYEQEDGQYSNPENAWIGGFIGDLKSLVEEEQKYSIYDKTTNSYMCFNADKTRLNWYTSMLPVDCFTEQEIRELDNGDVLFEHFAVKVEELEE